MLSAKEHIGRLDRRITFKQKVTGTDESNQEKVLGWEDIDTSPTVWASVEENSGSENIQANQLRGVETAVFTIRYRTDISVLNVIVYQGLKWDIHFIGELGRKRFLKIVAESGGQYSEDSEGGQFNDLQFSSAFA
jgi:SPP1 family predicted phage head-tail adaptor